MPRRLPLLLALIALLCAGCSGASESRRGRDGERSTSSAVNGSAVLPAPSEFAAEIGEKGIQRVLVERLPQDPRQHVDELEPHGLLYLPHPYVVPGGRFNEMYGWDSYFIQVGLPIAGRTDLEKAMIDNFLYQIEHYGTILNANRTYYLTRSQPPFLTAMILGVYNRTRDRAWLESTLPAIDKYYGYWTTAPGARSFAGGERCR